MGPPPLSPSHCTCSLSFFVQWLTKVLAQTANEQTNAGWRLTELES